MLGLCLRRTEDREPRQPAAFVSFVAAGRMRSAGWTRYDLSSCVDSAGSSTTDETRSGRVWALIHTLVGT
jgi:hypothetical protein